VFFLGGPDNSKKRRKPVPLSLQKELLLRCKGKCELCGLDFYKSKIKPEFHHKDGNPKNNRPSNLIVLCPNCHTKIHSRPEKARRRRRSKRREESPLDMLKEVEDSILKRLDEINRRFSYLL